MQLTLANLLARGFVASRVCGVSFMMCVLRYSPKRFCSRLSRCGVPACRVIQMRNTARGFPSFLPQFRIKCRSIPCLEVEPPRPKRHFVLSIPPPSVDQSSQGDPQFRCDPTACAIPCKHLATEALPSVIRSSHFFTTTNVTGGAAETRKERASKGGASRAGRGRRLRCGGTARYPRGWWCSWR